jgi:hypothetical protein
MLAHRTPKALLLAAALTAGFAWAIPAHAQTPLTSAFTYQGEVAWNGGTPTSTVDLQFKLYSDAAAGSQIGVTVEKLATALTNSRFTTDLDFGPGAFDGSERYLEIAVRSPAGSGSYVTLNPRQRLAAGPNSVYSTKAATATNALALGGQGSAFYRDAGNLNAGTIADSRLAGTVARTNTAQTFTGAMTFPNAANSFTGSFTGSGAALTSLNASNITTGSILDSLLSSNVAFKNAANTFTNTNVFSGPVSVGGPGIMNSYTKFQINGTAAANSWAGMYINGSDPASWPFYGFATGGVVRAYLQYNGSTGATDYIQGAGSALTITNSGTVGIGITNPINQLEVNGNIRSNGGDFMLNGRGGGIGNGGGAGRALVDAGWNSIAGSGLIINFGNDFGATVVDSDLYSSFNMVAGIWPSLGTPQVRLGNDDTLPVGITKEVGSVINLDMNFRAGTPLPATRSAALRLDSRPGQPTFNFFTRSAGAVDERLVMSIQDAGFVGVNQANPVGTARFGVTAPTVGNGWGGIEIGTSSVDGRPFYGFNTGGGQRAWIEYNQPSNAMNFYLGGFNRQTISYSGSNTYFGHFGNVGVNCLGASTAELEIRGGAPGGNFNADMFLRPSLSGGGALKAISFAAATDGVATTNPTLYMAHFDGFGGYSDRLIINANGSVQVTGALSKAGGSFKIDHPLDPESKYLYHSFVESPDMMNVYNGTITTDANGYATIDLPNYFEALNKDFRYQLTIVDENDSTWSFAKVVQKVHNNTFVIRTSTPDLEVSWQVTGIRKDPWAEQNRIPTSIDKEPENKGKLLHPEAYGKPADTGINYRKDEKQPAANTNDAPLATR